MLPVVPEKRSGLALVEVSNRGGKFSPSYFNRAGKSRELDPDDPDYLEIVRETLRPALALKLAGPDKVLFGSDYPLIAPTRSFNEMEAVGLTPEERADICGNNAARLLGL